MSECGQAYPEYVFVEDLGDSHGAQSTRKKDALYNKTALGFHPYIKCVNWCVQDPAQETGPCQSNIDTGWRERDTN